MDTISSLYIKIDQLQREVAFNRETISSLRKHRNRLKVEIADMKLPLLVPIFTSVTRCTSFDSPGHRCNGGDEYRINKRDWCMQCKCYDPE